MDKKEPIKDFLYDSLDYIFIILIIGIVGLIISWRLNILFSNNSPIATENIENTEEVKKEKPKSPEENTEVKGKTLDEQIGKKEDKNTKEENQDIETKNNIVEVSIPEGSSSFDIAELLESKGLIEDSKTFLDKAEEMNLATKLKSGDFEIEKGSTIEEVIEKITK